MRPDVIRRRGDAVGRTRCRSRRRDLIHLADYRLRYASYRADPDLQALHPLVPMIVQWDDHESANDSWEGGAQNHQPETEGDWKPARAGRDPGLSRMDAGLRRALEGL